MAFLRFLVADRNFDPRPLPPIWRNAPIVPQRAIGYLRRNEAEQARPMTALSEYERLEATGLWRENPTAQRREVVVSLGHATLIITSNTDLALAHWSLPAVERMNPGKEPALFAPGPEATESLEINDPSMVAAIERVRSVLARRRVRPGRLRLFLILAALFLFGGLAFLRLPTTLLNHTMRVVPEAKRSEIGEALLERISRIAGRPCRSGLGVPALTELDERLLRAGGGRLVVLPAGVRETAHLPGGVILIGRTLVEDFDTPDVVAGFVLAEDLRRTKQDPLRPLLTNAGFAETMRLYTTGKLSDAALDAYAEALLTAEPASLAVDPILARFQISGVSSTPYAFGLDPSGESTLALIEADPFPNGATRPVLPDAAWVSLQSICGP